MVYAKISSGAKRYLSSREGTEWSMCEVGIKVREKEGMGRGGWGVVAILNEKFGTYGNKYTNHSEAVQCGVHVQDIL
jgi:hypothetical protein